MNLVDFDCSARPSELNDRIRNFMGNFKADIDIIRDLSYTPESFIAIPKGYIAWFLEEPNLELWELASELIGSYAACSSDNTPRLERQGWQNKRHGHGIRIDPYPVHFEPVLWETLRGRGPDEHGQGNCMMAPLRQGVTVEPHGHDIASTYTGSEFRPETVKLTPYRRK